MSRRNLIPAGLDESTRVYQDNYAVMTAQQDLVEVLAVIFPRLVKRTPTGE